MFQEYYTDRDGQLRPGRKGINLKDSEFHKLSLMIPEMQKEAAKLFSVSNERMQQLPTSFEVTGRMLSPAESVKDSMRLSSDTGKKKLKLSIPCQSIGTAQGWGKNSTSVRGEEDDEERGDCLNHYMTKPQNSWVSYTPTYSPS